MVSVDKNTFKLSTDTACIAHFDYTKTEHSNPVKLSLVYFGKSQADECIARCEWGWSGWPDLAFCHSSWGPGTKLCETTW
jgi:hypothetical protein